MNPIVKDIIKVFTKKVPGEKYMEYKARVLKDIKEVPGVTDVKIHREKTPTVIYRFKLDGKQMGFRLGWRDTDNEHEEKLSGRGEKRTKPKRTKNRKS
jgi:hypothetical protein